MCIDWIYGLILRPIMKKITIVNVIVNQLDKSFYIWKQKYLIGHSPKDAVEHKDPDPSFIKIF